MRNHRRQRGFSLIELLIVIAIILILAMIAIPKVNQQLMSARETAAIQEIKTVHQAELQYYSTYNKYASSLSDLGPGNGVAGPAAAGILPKGLSEGKSGGYIFTVTAGTGGYAINANPESFGSSGRRTFFSDQTLVIRHNWSQEPATVNSPEIGAKDVSK